MKKFITSLALACILVLVPFILIHANDTVNVTIDGVQVDFDGQGPVIVDGRTLVPVRGVFEAIGFEVDWNEDTETVILSRADFEVIIIIGNNWFTTNGFGASGGLDVPAQIIGGRTLLPIRAVLESVGYDVDWDGETATVAVTKAPAGIVHQFHDAGFSLELPAAWEGLIGLHEFETLLGQLVEIYHIPTREEFNFTPPAGGTLWTFGRTAGEHFTEENPPIMAGGSAILAQTGGYTYFVNTPSDVQFNPEPGSVTAAEYRRIDAQLALILNSFRLL